MELVASLAIPHNGKVRTIELLKGDLANIPDEHAVDILIVSAFPNDYLPTPTSLIGALDRSGISVARLAESRESDFREQFSCWISRPLSAPMPFRRILCIESGWSGTPPQITDETCSGLLRPCS